MKKKLIIIIGVVLAVVLVAGGCVVGKRIYKMRPVKIHQLTESVFPEDTPYCPAQMMSYVIEAADGSLAVIDGGNWDDADYLLEYLKELGGENPRIKAWFITHAHNDHYGALNKLLDTNTVPQIDNLYLNFPDESFQLQNFPETTIQYTGEFMNRVKEHNLPLKTINVGDKVKLSNATFEVIYIASDKITYNQPNNGSLVIRLEACGQSVLFTADIGAEASYELIRVVDEKLIQADIVQMSHHGQSGAARIFYKTVNPKACLWPTPQWLWDNDFGEGFDTHIFTTVETRMWMDKLGVKHHIVSKDGTQVITLPVDFDEPWGIEDCLPDDYVKNK